VSKEQNGISNSPYILLLGVVQTMMKALKLTFTQVEDNLKGKISVALDKLLKDGYIYKTF